MKKNFHWLIVGLATFTIGVCAAWTHFLFPAQIITQTADVKIGVDATDVVAPQNLSGKVEAIFVKSATDETKSTVIELTVVNGLTEPISYYSQFGRWTGYFYTKSGKKVEYQWGCVTGSRIVTIQSGESALVRVPNTLQKSGTYLVGLPFQVGRDNKSEQVWSDEFSFIRR